MLYRYGRNLYHTVTREFSYWKNTLTDRSPKLLVLVYHRVLPDVPSNPFNMVVSREVFVRQLKKLLDRYPLISLDDAVGQCADGKARAKTQVVITFDDGFKDNYDIAFPVLREMNIPASFFVNTAFVGASLPPCYWRLLVMLDNAVRIPELVIDGRVIYGKGRVEPKELCISRILKIARSSKPGTIDMIIKDLEKESSFRPLYKDDLCMEWREVKELAASGMTIGSHGVWHRSLAQMDLSEAEDEILDSKSAIEGNIRMPCNYFSFPFGSVNDYNDRLIGCARSAGYKACLLNIRGYNHILPGSLTFKRIAMEDNTDMSRLLG